MRSTGEVVRPLARKVATCTTVPQTSFGSGRNEISNWLGGAPRHRLRCLGLRKLSASDRSFAITPWNRPPGLSIALLTIAGLRFWPAVVVAVVLAELLVRGTGDRLADHPDGGLAALCSLHGSAGKESMKPFWKQHARALIIGAVLAVSLAVILILDAT